MSGSGSLNGFKTLICALALAVMFTGCVKRKPRTEVPQEQTEKKCGLRCRLKEKSKKIREGKRTGIKQDKNTTPEK